MGETEIHDLSDRELAALMDRVNVETLRRARGKRL